MATGNRRETTDYHIHYRNLSQSRYPLIMILFGDSTRPKSDGSAFGIRSTPSRIAFVRPRKKRVGRCFATFRLVGRDKSPGRTDNASGKFANHSAACPRVTAPRQQLYPSSVRAFTHCTRCNIIHYAHALGLYSVSRPVAATCTRFRITGNLYWPISLLSIRPRLSRGLGTRSFSQSVLTWVSP